MQCGPAPVKGIKMGHVYLPYDTDFVFAEVNGDRVTWEVSDNGDLFPIRLDPQSVGKTISTKAVGKDERVDITNHYKFQEGRYQLIVFQVYRLCSGSIFLFTIVYIYEYYLISTGTKEERDSMSRAARHNQSKNKVKQRAIKDLHRTQQDVSVQLKGDEQKDGSVVIKLTVIELINKGRCKD